MTPLDLAHTFVTESVNVEALIVALAIAGVGAILFVQKATPPIVAMTVVVIGIVVGIGGVTVLKKETVHQDTTVGGATPDDAVHGLCEALETAADGNAAEAQAIFTNQAHSGLHVLASDVEDVDRKLAARLLEAKQRVEEDVFDTAPAAKTERDLQALVDVTAEAREALGDEEPACAS